MSENVRSQKWLAISFFVVCNLIFFGLIYAIITRSADLTYSNWMGNFRASPEARSEVAEISKDNPIVLVKGQQIRVGRIELIYRGLSSGELRLDIVLLDLDPQYAYHREIPIAEAKKGIQVSDRRFKVLSVNRLNLKLLLLDPSI